jgi:uncharacterized DUF497 family protein
MMEFDFNQEKNDLLFKKRGVTFYDVIESIAEKGILLNSIILTNKNTLDKKSLQLTLMGMPIVCLMWLKGINGS